MNEMWIYEYMYGWIDVLFIESFVEEEESVMSKSNGDAGVRRVVREGGVDGYLFMGRSYRVGWSSTGIIFHSGRSISNINQQQKVIHHYHHYWQFRIMRVQVDWLCLIERRKNEDW